MPTYKFIAYITIVSDEVVTTKKIRRDIESCLCDDDGDNYEDTEIEVHVGA